MARPLTALVVPSFYPSSPSTTLETVQQIAPSQTEDVHLLCRIATRDLQAFDGLYTRYAPRLRGYLARLLSDQTLVEEVCNDVMLVVWQQATRVPTAVPLWAWLCGIAWHKARKARARTSCRAMTLELPQEGSPETPENLLLHQEYKRHLIRALDALPLSERTTLVLLVQHGCAYQDIAAAMDIPVSTVRTRVSRACQRLRLRIAALESGPSSPLSLTSSQQVASVSTSRRHRAW